MTTFTLTEKEHINIGNILNAIDLLFGVDAIVEQRYLFSPSNGIGSTREYEVKLKNGIVIRKDVTDYDNW